MLQSLLPLIPTIASLLEKYGVIGDTKEQLEKEIQKVVLEKEKTLQQEIKEKTSIIKSELTSDTFTRWARPSVVYVGLATIVYNYSIFPTLAAASDNVVAFPLELPEAFWWAWSGVVGTWAISRGIEKVKRGDKHI